MKTILLSLLSIGFIATAQTPFTGTISNSMGGTGRAAITPEEIGLLNPAALVHQDGYQLSTAYRDYNTENNGSAYDMMIHIAESERDSMFPLAITYHKQRHFYGSAMDRVQDLHFTTANIIFQNFSFGVDGVKHKYEPGVGNKIDEWDGSIGVLYLVSENLGLGLTHRNILSSNSPYLNRSVEFGVNYLFETFLRLTFDIAYGTEKNPGHDAIYMLGVEHKLIDYFPVRVGFRIDDVISENYWTIGVGWKGPKIGLDFSWEKNFSKNDEYGTSVDLKVYF